MIYSGKLETWMLNQDSLTSRMKRVWCKFNISLSKQIYTYILIIFLFKTSTYSHGNESVPKSTSQRYGKNVNNLREILGIPNYELNFYHSYPYTEVTKAPG